MELELEKRCCAESVVQRCVFASAKMCCVYECTRCHVLVQNRLVDVVVYRNLQMYSSCWLDESATCRGAHESDG